jgi:hypothetical protein
MEYIYVRNQDLQVALSMPGVFSLGMIPRGESGLDWKKLSENNVDRVERGQNIRIGENCPWGMGTEPGVFTFRYISTLPDNVLHFSALDNSNIQGMCDRQRCVFIAKQFKQQQTCRTHIFFKLVKCRCQTSTATNMNCRYGGFGQKGGDAEFEFQASRSWSRLAHRLHLLFNR